MTSGGWTHASRKEAEWHTSQAPGKPAQLPKGFDFFLVLRSLLRHQKRVFSSTEPCNVFPQFSDSVRGNLPRKTPFDEIQSKGQWSKPRERNFHKKQSKARGKKFEKRQQPAKGPWSLELILLYCKQVECSKLGEVGSSVPPVFPSPRSFQTTSRWFLPWSV